MAEEESPKRKLTWLWIILAVVGVFIIITVLIVVLIGSATSGLTKPVDEQLALIKKGDIQGAYDATSAQFKSATTLQDFTTVINQYPILKNQKKIVFNERITKNNDGCVRGVINGEKNGSIGIVYRLVKEGKAWKILVIRINIPEGVTCSNAF